MITSINEFRKIFELCEGDMEDMVSLVRKVSNDQYKQVYYGFDYIEIKLLEPNYEEKQKIQQEITDQLLIKFEDCISEIYAEETGWFKIYLKHDK